MGAAVPYAIAAKFAYPERTVIACVGDGAMQMIGNNALITISKYWKEWSDPRLVVLVLRNLDLNQVTWEQRVLSGDPKFDASQKVPPFDYAGYAESLGLLGVRMRTPEEIVPGWERALSADRPVVGEAHTDPEVPPLPPHISLEQASNYVKSVAKGDPHAWRMIKQSAKALAENYLPHGKG
jgi:pyruvate dehydrogenase (quinone)